MCLRFICKYAHFIYIPYIENNDIFSCGIIILIIANNNLILIDVLNGWHLVSVSVGERVSIRVEYIFFILQSHSSVRNFTQMEYNTLDLIFYSLMQNQFRKHFITISALVIKFVTRIALILSHTNTHTFPRLSLPFYFIISRCVTQYTYTRIVLVLYKQQYEYEYDKWNRRQFITVHPNESLVLSSFAPFTPTQK